ncbi:MAG TPA: hypothetical protein VHK24_13140 [Steroidobacter sp.]|nr:hypothetical protein [Steroidobacter sp.]
MTDAVGADEAFSIRASGAISACANEGCVATSAPLPMFDNLQKEHE